MANFIIGLMVGAASTIMFIAVASSGNKRIYSQEELDEILKEKLHEQSNRKAQ